jgi:AraC-like DNA-binding protein
MLLNPAMTGAASSSSTWLRGLVDLFASQGVKPADLFAEAGFDFGRLGNRHARFTTREVTRLWEIGVTRTGQPNLGLDRDLVRRHLNFQFAARAMSSSPTLLAGLQALAHYLELIQDSTAFRLQPQRGDCWIDLAGWAEGGMPRQRVEFGLMCFLLLSQQVTRRPVRAIAVEFTFPGPQDYHPYRMAFQCPIRFGCAHNRMRLPRDDLALPIVGTAESLHDLHEQVLESFLARMGTARTSYRASEEIVRRLHLGEPARAQVARRLHLAEPVLEQRLRDDGVQFHTLLDEVRRELAGHYLAQPGLDLDKVARLLGWQATPALTAACKRWWGVQPARYRRRLAGEDVPT